MNGWSGSAAEIGLAGAGGLELELRQVQFQRTEMAGVQGGLQQALALGEVFEDGAGLILAAPRADRGGHHAHQRGRMKRALEKSDVAEQLPEPNRIRVALGTAALAGQQHDRKIRPRRLIVEPAHQAAQIRGLDRLVRDHGKAGPGLDLPLQRRQIVADVGVDGRPP